MHNRVIMMLAGMLMLALAACGAPQRTVEQNQQDIAQLTQDFMALGPNVDPAEAERAALVAITHTAELAKAYEITDSPLMHNSKVNMGLKPRGLCWHWAEDMEKRMRQENFQTLDLHRAIANFDNIRLEHSTLIMSAKGANMQDGLVIDPWRKGGVLFWAPVREDTRYEWRPQAYVMEFKRNKREYEAARGGVTG